MEESLSFMPQSKSSSRQLFITPNLMSIFFLGFASGLPLLLTGSTLQAWYTVSQVNLVTIGILTLVGQPYVYKFLWAPFLDRYALSQQGLRRGWLLLLQLLLVAGIVAMGCFKPDRHPLFLAALALCVAFFSATQDIVIDAYRTEILSPELRGLGAGLNTMGYRVAMLVSGALALVMADQIGWKYTYWFMALLMGLQLLVTVFMKERPLPTSSPVALSKAILEPFIALLYKRQTIGILLFIVLYKLGDVFTMVLGTSFLIRAVGFSLTDIGLMYKLVGMAGLFIGVMAGGFWMKRIKLLTALVIFGVIQALANLPFMGLAILGKNYLLLIVTVFAENFGSGLASVAFLAFIMGLCDQRFTATHFALFTALAAVGRVFAGPFAGIMVEHIGWVQYYFWAFLMGFPGIIMLIFFKKTLGI